MTVQQNLVFVIEQDGALAAACERSLKAVGFEVEIFADGKPAYERLAVEPAPRLVLLDLQLPNVSGHEIAWEIWFNLNGSRIIIIAPDQKTAAIYQNKDGVDHVLIKPFSPDELTGIVRPYLYSRSKG